MTALKQMGIMAEVLMSFFARESQVPDMNDKHCLGYFMNGLKEEINTTYIMT